MQRRSIKDIEPNAYKAMLGMEQYIKNSQLPALLREMIKIRADITFQLTDPCCYNQPYAYWLIFNKPQKQVPCV